MGTKLLWIAARVQGQAEALYALELEGWQKRRQRGRGLLGSRSLKAPWTYYTVCALSNSMSSIAQPVK